MVHCSVEWLTRFFAFAILSFGFFVLFCFSTCSSHSVSSSKFDVVLKITKVFGISVVRPISAGYRHPNAWTRDCSEGWDFVFLPQLPFDPHDSVMLTGIQLICCLCSQVFPSGNTCWGVTQGWACFQLVGEREVCVAVGLSSEFEVELRNFFFTEFLFCNEEKQVIFETGRIWLKIGFNFFHLCL